MNFIRLTSADDMYFRELLELYEISFPQHEQRIFDDQIRVLDNSAYHCEVILEDDEFVGLICYWKTKRFSYIEHFAIHPNRRRIIWGHAVCKNLLK
ncbi:GNAT family N-acetyltransferase [Paenibacillus alvei]|uniref:GNAT family N-acetyltransferase n=1 Tax=Paenibacillus alvei TaxID=44250 RepID=UPI0013DD28F5|nr:GNAT family N-acetyltransferase [Paenibacillus alvei]